MKHPSRWFQFKSLKSKLIASFMALAFLAGASLGIIAYLHSSASLTDNRGDFLQGLATETADKIDRNLFERYGDVQAFAVNPNAIGTPEQATVMANTFTKLYGFYDLMIVADASGKIIAANTVTSEGKSLDTSSLIGRSVRGEPWFDKVISGEIKAGETFCDDLTEDKLVAEVYKSRGLALGFSAPVLDASGKVVRVWSNRASWDRIVGEMVNSKINHLKAKGSTMVECQVLSSKASCCMMPIPRPYCR